MLYEIKQKITKDWILDKVSQEQVMEHYLCVPIQTRNKFKSPLREDKNPSCSFFYSKQGKLYFRDFSNDKSLDCFDVACQVTGLPFKEVLRQVVSDMNLQSESFIVKNYDHLNAVKEEAKRDTQITIAPLLKNDQWALDAHAKSFWLEYGITPSTLRKFKVFQLHLAYVNGSRVFTYNGLEPAFAYYFDAGFFKLYFPHSTGTRFMQNTTQIQGLQQLPSRGNLLVITKSMKDVMVFSEYGVHAIAPQSESYTFSDEDVLDWSKRFSRIVIVYDFDYTGVTNANKWRKKYGWEYRFVERAKDISDLYKSSPYHAEQWINTLKHDSNRDT